MNKPSTGPREVGHASFHFDNNLCRRLVSLKVDSPETAFDTTFSVYLYYLYKSYENDGIEGKPLGFRAPGTSTRLHVFRLDKLDVDDGTFSAFRTSMKQLVEHMLSGRHDAPDRADKSDIEWLPEPETQAFAGFALETSADDSATQGLGVALDMTIGLRDNAASAHVTYDSNLFSSTDIRALFSNYQAALTCVLDDPEIKLSNLELVSNDERRRMDDLCGDTAASYPTGSTIHQLFEEQVQRTPKNLALDYHGETFTYEDLNSKANRLAAHLRDQCDFKRGDIAAILSDRSPAMVIGALGVLKAGGAYLPIESSFPRERIVAMLEDSSTDIVLSSSADFETTSFCQLHEKKAPLRHVVRNGGRLPISDLNGLPFPDRSLIDHEKYNDHIGQAMVKNAIAIQATRGCPFKCLYCHKIWGKKHVCRSAEHLYQEVKLHYDLGVRRFVIIDDIFNMDRRNTTAFFRSVIANRLDAQFFFPNGLRGDLLTSEQIDLMVEAGAVNLALALETASHRLQKLIRKNLNLDKLHKNIDYIASRYPQVILELFTMHGFPTETEEEAYSTLEFIKSIRWIHFPYVHILKIYPDTDMERLALECGVSKASIDASVSLAYHELPLTLPFPKDFTLQYQSQFLNGYFLNRERLLKVLPFQMALLSERECLQKYNSYLPVQLNNVNDLLDLCKASPQELTGHQFVDENRFSVPDLNSKLRSAFPSSRSDPDALRILLIDLSQFFTGEHKILYDVVEPPLGLMYLLSYLKQQLGPAVSGRILKSRVDFDSYAALKSILDDYKPDVIGVRTLTFYKDLFHRTISAIRQWGYKVPIVAGGPYATSSYNSMLKDRNVDVAVLGEGEETFLDLVKVILANRRNLPDERVLARIPGLAYVAAKPSLPRKLFNRTILSVDTLVNDPKPPPANPPILGRPDDLCYIIYTSGSTGTPKGAMIEHRNVVRLLFNSKFQFDFGSSDVWALFHSFCFDFSVWEMYGALLFGGKLVLVPKQTTSNPVLFLKLIEERGVTVLNQVPSVFYNLANTALEEPTGKLALRYIIFGGEQLNPLKLARFYRAYPDIRYVNMYGITETTVHVTFKRLEERDMHCALSNIGKPIPTLRVHMMDKSHRRLPAGSVGEMCVCGAGVGRGYLGRPELTAQKFVMSRYDKNERLYCSGDLARLLPSGDLQYLGRIDHQVKIRGFRIELGEIESQLLRQDGIRDATVLAKETTQGDKYLCAYVVAAGRFDKDVAREHLAKKLPEYMVPSVFVRLDKIPLTANGKADRNALAAMAVGTADENGQDAGTALERRLVQIWRDVLGTQQVGLHDNFYEMGGSSISFIQLNIRIEHEFDVEFDINDYMKVRTVKDLSSLMRGKYGRCDAGGT